jgi:hypothetical protein
MTAPRRPRSRVTATALLGLLGVLICLCTNGAALAQSQPGAGCTPPPPFSLPTIEAPSLPDYAALRSGRTNVFYRPGQSDDSTTLSDNASCKIKEGDQINVDDTGKADISFQDALIVHVYRQSQLQLTTDVDASCPTCLALGADLILGTIDASVPNSTLQALGNQRLGEIHTGNWTTIRAVYGSHVVVPAMPVPNASSSMDAMLAAQSQPASLPGLTQFLVYFDGLRSYALVRRGGPLLVSTPLAQALVHEGEHAQVSLGQASPDVLPLRRAELGPGFPHLEALTQNELTDATDLAVTTSIVSTPPKPVPARAARTFGATLFGIDEGFRVPEMMDDIHPGWDRVLLSWAQAQPSADDMTGLTRTVALDRIDDDLGRGTSVTGVLQYTPSWAAADPEDGGAAVPRGLYAPYDSQLNYWGRFVSEAVASYAGRIDDWVIWNDADIPRSEPGSSWAGTDEDFAQLLKVGYLAAKRANPRAIVVFPSISYWQEQRGGASNDRFYHRILNILSRDPEARAHNFYHDAVALNLYENPDDILRVHDVIRQIQREFGIDRPIWLAETNAMPVDDATVHCSGDAPAPTTMVQQANFAVQAFALAAAAGYERAAFYKALDDSPCAGPPAGVARLPGTNRQDWRPVENALRVAIVSFDGFTSATFKPLLRGTQDWNSWPDDPGSYFPNWQVYQVAFDKPGGTRVTVLWNADGNPVRARIRANGTRATLVSLSGATSSLQPALGWWVFDLPAATATDYPRDYPGYFYIGGDPVFIVEEGVDPARPVEQPELGDPGSAVPDFDLLAVPAGGQSVNEERKATFRLRSRGHEGFSAPITLSVVSWSKEDGPQQGPDSLPLQVTLDSMQSGQQTSVDIDASAAPNGVYHLTIRGIAADLSHTVDLAVEVQ